MKLSDNRIITLPPARLAGRYRLQARRPDGSVRVDSGWIENLITNAGLNALGESVALANWAVVGTGNAAPLVGDTQLQAPLAKVQGGGISRGIVTSGERYGWEQRTYSFPQGAVVGNVSEVGVGWADSLTMPVFSRSLVTPTQTYIAMDQLTLTYQVRMYVPTTADLVGGPVNIGGVNYNYTIRPINIESNGQAGNRVGMGWAPDFLTRGATARLWQQSAGSFPVSAYRAPCVLTPAINSTLWASSGVNQNFSSGAGGDTSAGNTNAPYVSNSLQCFFTSKWSTAIANWAEGIQGFIFSGMFGTYQCILDGAIPKDNTKELTMTWKQSWSRRP